MSQVRHVKQVDPSRRIPPPREEFPFGRLDVKETGWMAGWMSERRVAGWMSERRE